MAGRPDGRHGMIPHFSFDGRPRNDLLSDLRRAARDTGCFYARHPLLPDPRCAQALADARAFFDQDLDAKRALAIELSPHWRGYSEMRNARDWREQIHFGREEAHCDSAADYARLRGPNLWPGDDGWRGRVLRLMDDLERAGRDILGALALSLDLPSSWFLGEDEEPYVLLKLIHYPATEVPQSGVAAHVDFSWITLLLQDDCGGLEVRSPAGAWRAVPPAGGALLVNIGEILQFATRGYYVATPHRVRMGPASRPRISMPFFLNPSLTTLVATAPVDPPPIAGLEPAERDHVHRVLTVRERDPFVFGEAEWRRKGLGVWCASCVS